MKFNKIFILLMALSLTGCSLTGERDDSSDDSGKEQETNNGNSQNNNNTDNGMAIQIIMGMVIPTPTMVTVITLIQILVMTLLLEWQGCKILQSSTVGIGL